MLFSESKIFETYTLFLLGKLVKKSEGKTKNHNTNCTKHKPSTTLAARISSFKN